ncbi:hypothetical protein [Oceanimonas smirnovii]|uniref:hypothetical protein n=1 Tax=Oceanimonas smirnovii TaxID=264574 RepID=UPI00037B1F40|nr:hypothetical protein [Oceanimonas smirnovii]
MTAFHPITQPAGELAINHMRHLLKRCRIASWWSKQPRAVREGLCRAAALKPAAYWSKPLESMNDAEREAIRRAVVELKNALGSFTATNRSEWLHVADYKHPESDEEKMEAKQEAERRHALQQQALMIQQRAEMVKAAQR